MSKVKYDTVDTVIGGIRQLEQERGRPTTEERRPGVPQHREQLEGTSLRESEGTVGVEPTRDLRTTLSQSVSLRMEGLWLRKLKLS